MTIAVNIGDADLNELLSKVEAGEEVILVRGDTPVAQIRSLAQPASDPEARRRAIEEIRAFRERMPRVTQAEIAEWKAIGRK